MKLPLSCAFALALSALLACSSAPEAPERPRYTLVLLKTGPADAQLAGEERNAAFAGHMANIERLAEERELLVAGPYGLARHDPRLRGIFVLNTGDRERAMGWASTDPTTQRGVFVLEYHDLDTDAPLAAALERHFAEQAEAEREGRTLELAQTMRNYVWLTAEDGERARRELAPLRDGGGVFLLGRLDGSRALALLDAGDVAEAEERYADELERVGAHTLDEWYGSVELARMDER